MHQRVLTLDFGFLFPSYIYLLCSSVSLLQLHNDFVELAFEIKWHEVILADGLPGVGADVKRLVQRNAKAHRAPDVACCDLLAVDEQRSGPTLTRAASVVVGNGITA